MPLWGTTTADESRPKWMTPTELRDVTAQKEGWVQFNNNSQKREVLVAIGGLEDALGDPSVADIRVIQNDQAVIGQATIPAGNFIVDVVFNEPVIVASRASIRLQLTKVGSAGGGASTLDMTPVSSFVHENVIRFGRNAVAGHNGSTYRIATGAIKLNSGTIKYLEDDGTTAGNDASLTLNDSNSGPDPLLIFATA